MTEDNFFIKSSYKPNTILETIEREDRKYWTSHRISQSYYYQYYIYKFCRKFIKAEKIKSVIDIGCGFAVKLMELIYPICNEVYGIDQERIIQCCIKYFGLKTFISDDIENPKLVFDRKFDLIICSDIIEHLLNPDKLLFYIKRFCHKNTYIVISTPERDVLRGKNCNFSPKRTHIREWNMEEFRNYLENRKFEVISHKIYKNFKILIKIKNSIQRIKNDFINQLYKFNRFSNLKSLKHTQLILLQSNKSDKILSKSTEKLLKHSPTTYLNNFIDEFLIKIHYMIFKVYRFIKKKS